MSMQRNQNPQPVHFGDPDPLNPPDSLDLFPLEGPGHPRGGGRIHGPNDEVTTEIAIATHTGLGRYVFGGTGGPINPNQGFQQAAKRDEALETNLIALRDYLLEKKGFRYNPKLLKERTLEGKIREYLERPVDSSRRTHPKVVRILIFAGHGVVNEDNLEDDFYNFTFTGGNDQPYDFHHLKNTLIDSTSKDILAIPVLCCCCSGKMIRLINKTERKPNNSVVIAACREADNINQSYLGNDFLLTFLEAFQYRSGSDTAETWKEAWRDWGSYKARLQTLITPRNSEQVPQLEQYDTKLTLPRVAFEDIVGKPPKVAATRGSVAK